MAKSKRLYKDRLYIYGGREHRAIELVEALFLSGMALDDIAEIVEVDRAAFRRSFKTQLEQLGGIHKGLVISAGISFALSGQTGNNKILELLLRKYNFIEGDVLDNENPPTPWTVVLDKDTKIPTDTALVKVKALLPTKKKTAKKKTAKKKIKK